MILDHDYLFTSSFGKHKYLEETILNGKFKILKVYIQ